MALHWWLASFGPIAVVGVEGIGPYGAGLARHLRAAGGAVVEVDCPDRQARHRHGTSDPVDAIAAARAAQSGTASGAAKHRDGPVEQMRVLLVARRSARSHRIQVLNQMRRLTFTGPEEIRQRFAGLSALVFVKTAAAMRPRAGVDPVVYVTNRTLRDMARRVVALNDEVGGIDEVLEPLVAATAPRLLAVYGLGFRGAAELLVAAGDNPDRLRSEAAWAHLCGVAPIPASSGNTIRVRLNRDGNRHANSVLYRIVLTRMSSDERTRAYVQRRRGEGRTTGEIARILKRYVAPETYKALPRLTTSRGSLRHGSAWLHNRLAPPARAAPKTNCRPSSPRRHPRSRPRDLRRACDPFAHPSHVRPRRTRPSTTHTSIIRSRPAARLHPRLWDARSRSEVPFPSSSRAACDHSGSGGYVSVSADARIPRPLTDRAREIPQPACLEASSHRCRRAL